MAPQPARRYRTPHVRTRGLPAVHTVRADDGVPLRALAWPGEGPGLLLLHGANGNADMWQAVADALAPLRAAATDHRGFGDTPGPEGTCTTQQHVRDTEAVRAALGLERPVLLGYSGGAVDAVHHAATHPERIAALVLVDPPMFHPPPPEVLAFFRTAPRDFATVDAFVHLLREGPLARGASVAGLRAYAAALLRPEGGRLVRRSMPHALPEWNQSLQQLDPWALAARVRAPTLVVRAEASPFLPEEVAAKLAASLPPGSRVAVVEEASHLVPTDDPLALAQAVREFVAELS